MGAQTTSKDEKLRAVAEQTGRLILRHGIEGLSHTRVARASKVSRAWLYKYVGKGRGDLMRFATDYFGVELAKLETRPRTGSRAEWVEDSVAGLTGLLAAAQEAPWVLPLYHRHLGSDDPIGECIAAVEARYLGTAGAEVRRVLGCPLPEARRIAALLLSTRMGIAYRHQLEGFPEATHTSWLATRFERWLQTL